MTLPSIHFDTAGNAVAILFHAFITLPHDGEHLIPLSFEDRPHGVQPVRHAALIDDVQ